MEILFLGTGSAFCVHNYHSNALIIQNKKHLLVDAGGDLRLALNEANLSYKDIDAVYISHFHTDHIGGLEYLAFKSFFDTEMPKIKLIIREDMIASLWDNSLKAGLGIINGGQLNLNDFFELIPVKDLFVWENVSFNLVETLHVSDVPQILPVYGLMIHGCKKVYITSDTRYVPTLLKESYEKADIIIHDCETGDYISVIHAHFSELMTLPDSIKQKTWLWHYQDNVSNDIENWQQKAKENSFIGFLTKGQRLTIC